MKRNQYLAVFVALLIVGGGSFYAGKTMAKGSVQKGQFNTTFTGAGGAGFTTSRGGARTGAIGGFTAGEILSASNGSISIKQQNGSSTQIVLIGPSTQILTQTAGTASDLTNGTNVTIMGTPNSDGSLTATSIQIRPAGMTAPVRTVVQ